MLREQGEPAIAHAYAKFQIVYTVESLYIITPHRSAPGARRAPGDRATGEAGTGAAGTPVACGSDSKILGPPYCSHDLGTAGLTLGIHSLTHKRTIPIHPCTVRGTWPLYSKISIVVHICVIDCVCVAARNRTVKAYGAPPGGGGQLLFGAPDGQIPFAPHTSCARGAPTSARFPHPWRANARLPCLQSFMMMPS